MVFEATTDAGFVVVFFGFGAATAPKSKHLSSHGPKRGRSVGIGAFLHRKGKICCRM